MKENLPPALHSSHPTKLVATFTRLRVTFTRPVPKFYRNSTSLSSFPPPPFVMLFSLYHKRQGRAPHGSCACLHPHLTSCCRRVKAMGKCRVLLVHSPNVPLSPVQKLLEDRDFAILLSRHWEDAERARALVPADQLKYVFLDATLCAGAGWEQFLYRLQQAAADVICVSFHPPFPHTLAQLLTHPSNGAGADSGDLNSRAPVVVGESASF